jgi:hypothetical protein
MKKMEAEFSSDPSPFAVITMLPGFIPARTITMQRPKQAACTKA